MNPAAKAGEVIGGRYTVGRMIGRGGFADIFEATDSQGGVRVALKLLRDNIERDPMAIARFREEARVQERVRHPNVATLLDAGIARGRPYLVMELVGGRSLATVLADETRLDPVRASVLAYQALSGLSATHAVGVLHRDLKPGNLMLEPGPGRPYERVALIDFGFAAIGRATGFTMLGTVVGSPAYMAPERLQDRNIDHRSDLYSLGVVVYEMLTGKVPFTGDDDEVALSHMQRSPAAPSTISPDVPPGLDAVVLRALAKDPADRPASAQAMADELERAVHGSAG